MSLYALKGTKADFCLPLHSKDGTSSLHPEGQYSLIKKKKEPYSTLSSQTKFPLNERFVCVRCKHKTLNRAYNNHSRSFKRSGPLFPCQSREL